MRIPVVVCVLAAVSCLVGCSTKATVVDIADHKVTLEKARLETGRKVTVYESGKLIAIPLRQVSKIEIFMDETITYQRELYYLGKVVLKNGDTFDSGRVVENRASMTYVRVADVLRGTVEKASVRMTFDQIKTVTFE